MPSPSLLQRLKERKLVQWALAYLAGAWVIYEGTGTAVETWDVPVLLVRSVHVLLVVGFFVTLVLAWYHGEKGHQRVSGPELLLLAALLVLAGVGLSALGPGPEDREPGLDRGVVRRSDDKPAIAVLPLQDFSPREEDAYFAEGVHEEIIAQLSKISGLTVISRNSAMVYRDQSTHAREIARALDVGFLLEGSARIGGDMVRLTLQLIDGQTDEHLWTEDYDRPYSVEEYIAIQGEIAAEVATHLRAEITPEEQARIDAVPTENLEAFEWFILGRNRFRNRSSANIRAAIRYYEAAIEQDSTFALAWAGLATAWTVLPFYESLPSAEGYRRGLEAARQALAWDPDLAQAHAVLGALALYHEWSWETAERHLLRAVELDPNYPESHFWLGTSQCLLGNWEIGLRSLETTVRLDPLGSNFQNTLALFLLMDGRVEEGIAVAYRETRRTGPDGIWLAPFLWDGGQQEEAIRVMRRWGERVGFSDPRRLDLILQAQGSPEHREAALEVAKNLEATPGIRSGELGLIYLMIDAQAEAERALRTALAAREVSLPYALLYATRRFSQYTEVLAIFEEEGMDVR